MTGRELVEWIKDNKAEDMEVFFLSDDGTLEIPKPEIMDNEIVKENYWEASALDSKLRSVIL